jgi:hypothetical protein
VWLAAALGIVLIGKCRGSGHSLHVGAHSTCGLPNIETQNGSAASVFITPRYCWLIGLRCGNDQKRASVLRGMRFLTKPISLSSI